MLTTAVFELVQQLYHDTEIGNVANGIGLVAFHHASFHHATINH